MAQKTRGGRDNLIHCPNCGEDYASTYRRCPFCNNKPARDSREEDDLEPFPLVDADREDAVDYEQPYDDTPAAPRGGKRLASAPLRTGSGRGGRSGSTGGGYGRRPSPARIAVYLVSLGPSWPGCFPAPAPRPSPPLPPAPPPVSSPVRPPAPRL